LLDVSGGGEETPRALQSIRVNTAREDLSRGRGDGVIGSREARYRVEQDHDIALVLDETLGLLEDHFRDLNVTLRRLIEGRADDLALHRALHVCDFFRPFVDQENDQ